MKHFPVLALLATTAFAPAQCLFTTVTQSSVGPSCNWASTGFCAVAALPAWLLSTLDVPNCRLEIEVNAFSGCGASVPIRVLVLGLQPATVPLPDFGLGCTLHVQPDLFFAQGNGPFLIDLPPGVQTFTFFAQGAAFSVPPLQPDGWWTFSDGVQVDLS